MSQIKLDLNNYGVNEVALNKEISHNHNFKPVSKFKNYWEYSFPEDYLSNIYFLDSNSDKMNANSLFVVVDSLKRIQAINLFFISNVDNVIRLLNNQFGNFQFKMESKISNILNKTKYIWVTDNNVEFSLWVPGGNDHEKSMKLLIYSSKVDENLGEWLISKK